MTRLSDRLTVRVGDDGSEGLGDGACDHEVQEVGGGTSFLVPTSLRQFPLQELVDHKVDDGLTDAEVAGGDAFVEARDTCLSVQRLDACPGGRRSVATAGTLDCQAER